MCSAVSREALSDSFQHVYSVTGPIRFAAASSFLIETCIEAIFRTAVLRVDKTRPCLLNADV
jgi:hypothetical protein